jgi:hypothetical protein
MDSIYGISFDNLKFFLIDNNNFPKQKVKLQAHTTKIDLFDNNFSPTFNLFFISLVFFDKLFRVAFKLITAFFFL